MGPAVDADRNRKVDRGGRMTQSKNSGWQKSYKKLWSEIKATDPWRYDLNEEFYANMHLKIMTEIEKRPIPKAGNSAGKVTSPPRSSWWSNWKDVRSWRNKNQG